MSNTDGYQGDEIDDLTALELLASLEELTEILLEKYSRDDE